MEMKISKRDKLVHLKSFCNLETGELDYSYFEYENTLYTKAVRMKALAARITKCKRCEGLNIKRFTESTPGWGNLNASIFFVGQSLHEPGVSSGLPFIKGSGYSIDAALRLSGLLRKDVFFSNVIHCHPPSNRETTPEEKNNCLPFLAKELAIVEPTLLIALGNDAKQMIQRMHNEGIPTCASKFIAMKHPATFMYSAPELRVGWIIKLSMEIDKCLNK